MTLSEILETLPPETKEQILNSLSSLQNTNNDSMSEKIDLLTIALSKAQGMIENVSRDKQAYGYKYADLAACYDAIRVPLCTNGLAVTQILKPDQNNKQFLITLLLHESGQWLKSTFYLDFYLENLILKQLNSLQKVGAVITYVRRYALSSIIGLAQENDDDGACVSNSLQSSNKIATGSGTNFTENKNITLIQELINLCHKHKLNPKEFANFHQVDSSVPETIKNAIENFDILKEQFINKEEK